MFDQRSSTGENTDAIDKILFKNGRLRIDLFSSAYKHISLKNESKQ